MEVNRQGCKIANLWLLNYFLSSWLQIYIYIYGCKITRLRTGLITLLETVQNLVMPWSKTHYLQNNRQPLHIHIFYTTNVFFLLNYLIKLTRSHSYKSAACLYDAIFYVFFLYFLYVHIFISKVRYNFFLYFLFYGICLYLIFKVRYNFFCIFCIFNVQYVYAVFLSRWYHIL